MEEYTDSREVLLDIKNLDISFKTHSGLLHVIRGIDIQLHEGESLAIVGESGSGKSVTVKSVVGILADNAVINSGEVNLTYKNDSGEKETVDLLKKDTLWIRKNVNGKRVAFVFQDPMTSLDPLMTIEDQIMEPLFLHFKMSKEDARAKALELLNEVGITEPEKRMKQYPHQLSGGMRQRVVIAIALACDPQILICDEPTTALDVTTQARILDLITELQIKRNLAVILITHNLGVVAKVSDYIYILYAGKILEKGTELDIFYRPMHPYTWGLMASIPSMDTTDKRLYAIPGTPPNLLHEPVGDAFAPRNRYAMGIDYKEAPPFFKVSSTHYVASWLMDERAPKVEMPDEVRAKIDYAKKVNMNYLND